MKKTKILAILLAGTMVAGLASGCGTAGNDEPGTEKGESTAATSNDSLVIANMDMSEKFSEFFVSSVPDQYVVDMTAALLLTSDRAGEVIYNGIEGETKEYNGTEYTYYSLADLTVTENEDGSVYYDFQLRDDVTFSDGVKLTADDVIFTLYAYCDPTYDGSATLYGLPIKGMEEYRANNAILSTLIAEAGEDNTDFSLWTEEQQTAFWDAVNDGGVAFAQEIVDVCVEYGMAADENDVATAAAAWGFELEEGATAKDFFLAIGETYGWSFSAMEAESGGSALSDLIPEEVYNMSTTNVETGESADYISGIEKTGDYSVRITTTSVDATAAANFIMAIQPLHYYGDADAYDYDAHNFGFPKGDLSSVREKTTVPLGAGPYVFQKYENKIVYMTANENYYLGAPKIANIQFKTTSTADMIPAVVQGTVDISAPDISKEALEQIKSENSNGEENGDVLSITLTDYLGYGYIGINSENVLVGDDHASEASKDLRKAIATVLSVYRDVVIDSWYGETASVINYPISNTSWAAPQSSDADYEVAFSKDVNGNDIYTEGMTEDEKYEAALQAALGYFEAAGYTVEDGKLTAAPEGAKLSYELTIPGGGSGDHPSMGIVTAASEALSTIGFNLVINDLADSNVLWDMLDGGTAELWCAAWSATLDPDMYQIYHSKGGSSNYYNVKSEELDALVMDARTNTDQSYRKAVYKQCLDFIVDFAVEIPIYQRTECSLYSTQRVNMDTVCKDQTPFYTWMREIENLELN